MSNSGISKFKKLTTINFKEGHYYLSRSVDVNFKYAQKFLRACKFLKNGKSKWRKSQPIFMSEYYYVNAMGTERLNNGKYQI